MIGENHPFFFLHDLFSRGDAKFNLSKYIYISDSLFDEREEIHISSQEITKYWVENAISSLRNNNELALHSKVNIKNKIYHIPMIDFSCDKLDSNVIDRLHCFLPRKISLNLAIYNSGRSFHAYSNQLLLPKEWIEFMGRLLLINPKEGRNIIDTRWVGHRLIGGYCALRWSNNTNQYLGMPERINYLSTNALEDKKTTILHTVKAEKPFSLV